MIAMDVKIVNVEEVRKDLMRLLEGLGDKAVNTFLRGAGAVAKASVKKSLKMGGRPAFAPLSAATVERRMRNKGTGRRASLAEGTQKAAKAEFKSFAGRFSAINKSLTPLGGASGVFAKSIRVRLNKGDQSVYIGPPSPRQARKAAAQGWKSLYDLFVIHARGSGRLPARPVVYLQSDDTDKIVKVAERVIDKALLGIGKNRGGRVSEFLRTDMTAAT